MKILVIRNILVFQFYGYVRYIKDILVDILTQYIGDLIKILKILKNKLQKII